MARILRWTHIALGISLGISLTSGLLCQVLNAQATAGDSQQTTDDQGRQLRDVFQGIDTSPSSSDRAVGRLTILLKDVDSFREVKPSYAFRSGDRFRFEVAANQDGWLYVLHAGADGVMKQLWPGKQDNNAIKAQATYEIPPRPGIFIFDKSAGEEHFYIAIRTTPEAPDLNAPPSHKKAAVPVKAKTPPATTPRDGTTEIKNFAVRDPFGETDRVIIFDDKSPYLYFSTLAEDKLKSAVIEFTLNHVD